MAVQAVVSEHLPGPQAQASLGRVVRRYGTPIAGLKHGLTHAFPSAGVLAEVGATEYGLPARAGGTVTALARAVQSGTVILDGSRARPDLTGSLTAVPGLSPAAAQHIALRLGTHDAHLREPRTVSSAGD